jgi:hypothetical protein
MKYKKRFYWLWAICTILSLIVFSILSITMGPIKFHVGAWRGFYFMITQYCIFWGILMTPLINQGFKIDDSECNNLKIRKSLMKYLFIASLIYNFSMLILIFTLFFNDDWDVASFIEVSTLLTIAAGAFLIPQLRKVFA